MASKNGGPCGRSSVPGHLIFLTRPGPGWRNPIDAFIRAKLRENGLAPSPEADRRTLIRRLYVRPDRPAADARGGRRVRRRRSRTDAYEKLVDRLLASPHYGERWARHWLDVVHYGDTHGYDKDKPRPNAWPYRDYVIRAFNEDKPYGRFVQEQIAGDVLFPGTADGVEALGFIAAGPWDFIGHDEVPETKIDGKIARILDRDDMVANTMSTFTSLTVHAPSATTTSSTRSRRKTTTACKPSSPPSTAPTGATIAIRTWPRRAGSDARQSELEERQNRLDGMAKKIAGCE